MPDWLPDWWVDFKKAATEILDFWHIYLVKYRVISVIGFLFSCWLLADAWLFYKENFKELESFGSAACIAAFMPGFIGLFITCLNNIAKRHEGHGE